jgi:hypothetical protein
VQGEREYHRRFASIFQQKRIVPEHGAAQLLFALSNFYLPALPVAASFILSVKPTHPSPG